ncbi:MAG TPA: ATP-binding protein, partial [Candidatus Limnocylindria bacterium]|nr:ATP-binding protein [Candidatus Limnocylindria bacterium]
AAQHPNSYRAELFVKECRDASAKLPEYLTELCLDPKKPVDGGPFYFPNLVSLLRAYMEEWELECAARVVSTEVSRCVIETLEYSIKARCLTLCEGFEGLGKTWAAENFCRQRPGRARYVQVPATDDECGFYREIAKAIGVSINLNSKARELRERIEDVLQSGDLAIIFDEAHWLFGVNGTRGGLPKRMLWVITALVNKGVPVAFVATPQWTGEQNVREETHALARRST